MVEEAHAKILERIDHKVARTEILNFYTSRRQTRGSRMSEEDKKNRKFQFALAKAKVDFQFWFAFTIGMLAIGYSLLSYYRDNFLGTIVADGVLLFACLFLVRVYNLKEKRFMDIKKEYIDG
jgi:uncharacterized membrane protein (DUF485 family)